MGVYLPYTSYDYTKMQGPSPDGYHVPSKDEWVALCGILTTTFSMAVNATTAGTYLKMPLAGYRLRSSSNVNSKNVYGYYWSFTAYSTDNAHILYFGSSALNPQTYSGRANGCSVRCFKNSPVIPTSSWTTLYDGSSVATGAGVFYNATDGLISVSGDGKTWYTIQDKNLGATTVYNQGDTVSDANCGYFYQRGNNYGFAHSGTITTSSTQVDASNYGPGNYYSSSTFIKRSSSPYDWSSVQNDNLWGGVTGVSPMSELNNAYIGEFNPFDDYQEVAYIQSSGTEYINTLFTPSNTTKVEWKMGGWSQSGSHQMFGTRYAWSSSGRGFAIVTDAYQFNKNASVSHGMTNGADHTGEFSQTGLYVDGTLKATPSTATFTSPGPLYLFGLNNNGSFAESAIMKYYYFKIYDNGTLVRDFIPCYNKTSGDIGLRDKVEEKFYANAGTGTFTKGPDGKLIAVGEKSVTSSVNYARTFTEHTYLESAGQYRMIGTSTGGAQIGDYPDNNTYVSSFDKTLTLPTDVAVKMSLPSGQTGSIKWEIYQ